MAVVTPGVFSMAALTSELNADPKGLGYSAHLDNPGDIATLMNTTGSTDQIFRNRVDSRDIMAGIVLTEFAALTQANRDYCIMIFSSPQVNTGDANVRTQVGTIFGVGTTSRTNLTAAAQKNASRSEALWGDGFSVTAGQVNTALGHV